MRRIGRTIARLNRWLAPAAAASSAVQDEGMGGTHVDALGIKAVFGEMEQANHTDSEHNH